MSILISWHLKLIFIGFILIALLLFLFCIEMKRQYVRSPLSKSKNITDYHWIMLLNPIFNLLDNWGSTVILDVIKYCDHPRWYEKIPPGGGTSNQRWDLQLEVGPPIGAGPPIRGETSNWRWDLQNSKMDVPPLIRWDLQLEVPSTIRGLTFNWRSCL